MYQTTTPKHLQHNCIYLLLPNHNLIRITHLRPYHLMDTSKNRYSLSPPIYTMIIYSLIIYSNYSVNPPSIETHSINQDKSNIILPKILSLLSVLSLKISSALLIFLFYFLSSPHISILF